MKVFTHKKSTTLAGNFTNKIFVFVALFFCLFCSIANAQSPIYFSSGNFANPNDWTQANATLMGTLVGTNILTTTPNGIGNQYFRFYSATSSGTNYSPNGTSDILLTSGVGVPLQVDGGSGKAFYLNIASASSNIVFKTNGSGTPGTSMVVAFEVQGTIQTVSSVVQVPLSAAVVGGQPVKVTATLSGTMPVGQGVYLRYTNDGYATSTVVAMNGADTKYTATIPGSNNTSATTCSYYIFTSGSGLSIAGSDADLYTINLNNNGGSNYSFTPTAGSVITSNGSGGGVWNVGSSWQGGIAPAASDNVEILNGDSIIITGALSQTGNVTVDSGGTLTLNPGGSTLVTLNGTNLILGNYVQTSGTLAGQNGGCTFYSNITLTGGSFNNQEWYDANSVLIFNGITSTTNIWNTGVSTPGLAIPYNVTINKTTTLPTLGNYTCLGTLNIISTFTLNTTNANLTVGGLTGGGKYLASGNQTFVVGTENINSNFSGAYDAGAVNNLTKVGIGVLTLTGASNWNGPTAIQNGAISVATLNQQIGSGTSNLGSPLSTAGNGNISLGSNTNTGGLIFTGTTYSSNRIINLAGTTGGGYIDASGTGPLTLSGANSASGTGSKTLTLQGNNTGTNTISGAIINNSGVNLTSVVKAGLGTWVLSGTNSYTGITSVKEGILLINGSTTTGSAVTVASGATLGGNGTAAGSITLNGIIAPGSTAGIVGTLNTGAVTLDSASQYNFDITNVAGTSGTNWDLLNSTGAVTINSSSSSPVVIMLTGSPAGFVSNGSYTWQFATGTSVASFASNKFSVNTSGFTPTFSGTFSVSNTGNNLNVVYTPGSLPVKITSVTADPLQENIQVAWKTENELNVKLYEVEKSTDGIMFSKVYTTNSIANNSNAASYSWIDLKPAAGYYYYRIKSVDLDGSFEYSEIVRVRIGNSISSITVFPNPVKNDLIQLQMNSIPSGVYNVRIVNSDGQTILVNKMNHLVNTLVESVQLNTILANGIYNLELSGPANYVVEIVVKK